MRIRYNILSLKEIEFKIDYDQKLVDKDAVTFELFHREKADRQLKTILVEAGAHIVTRQDDFILANDTVRAEFSLDPFDEVIKQDGEGLFRSSVPQLIDTFINVALGALRGIFAKNLVGTYLDGLVLPLIPMKVISDSQNKQSKKAKATK
jgi:hypothetical protein